MGTSGSYGGSGSARWDAAHEAFTELTAAGDASPAAVSADLLDKVLKALATALVSDDTDHGIVPQAGFPLHLSVSRPTGGGGGAGSATGRVGSGSPRQVLRGAARGAGAVAGAYALRDGDDASLRELGLDPEQLATLGPRAQVAHILQVILGDAAHPDDAALRRATAKHVKAVILADVPPSPADSIRGLVSEWIYELTLVELGSQQASASMSAAEMIRKQDWLRSWLNRRVRDIEIPDANRMTVQQFSTTAAKVTEEALRIFRNPSP